MQIKSNILCGAFSVLLLTSASVLADTWMGNGSIISHHGLKYGSQESGFNWPWPFEQYKMSL